MEEDCIGLDGKPLVGFTECCERSQHRRKNEWVILRMYKVGFQESVQASRSGSGRHRETAEIGTE